MSKLDKYIELIFVGIITALLYYFTYMFQVGYLSYYNIPSAFVEINSSIVIRRIIFLFTITTLVLLSTQGIFSVLVDIFPKWISNDIKILSVCLSGILWLSSVSAKYHKIPSMLILLIIIFILKICQIRVKYKQRNIEKEIANKNTPMFFDGIIKNHPKIYNILICMIIIMFIGDLVKNIGGLIVELNPREIEININNRRAIVVSEYRSKLIIKYKKANSKELEDEFNIIEIKDDFKMIFNKEKGVFNIAPF
ncbi:hypothetical protein [Clostridium sporogenes]|uniref:hypothetical protein n=1 Tax=Clostridium sporogenes TaxID=1509 RepID=UPI0005F00267|nr:hypothetical protein [Clostridium sporogenes]MBY7014699.1 hypothetical protein [Clostridium sporogenes]NFD93944.1 hypothetical protein [Clostridium sporogenes]NFE44867.1 hypothetical protein [Clostridium sporogenes]NFF15702.1 hypothetical protein [Clostridium sporogenes]NFF73412.1 hypothetical protein [Clostridium sporogenes]